MSSKFLSIFSKCGFVLNNGEETFNILNVDQRIFQSNLKEFFDESKDHLKRLKDFIENYLEDETNFLVSLLPTKNNLETVVSHSSNQDNLLKLLIEIEQLQEDLFEYLIVKTHTYCESDSNGDKMILNININVPTYIINQFRYQPKIYKPDDLCIKLMELISSINSSSIKKEIILCFPDILSDTMHDTIVNELKKLLSDNDLVSATLDTLSNLKFQNSTTNAIIEDLFERYGLVEEADLPSVIKFILKASSSLNSKEILSSLLNKTKFEEMTSETNRFLAFDIIREYFQISTNLINLFISNIQSFSDADSTSADSQTLKPIDFMVISIIYSFPQQFKQIDALFKQIVRDESTRNIKSMIQVTFKYGHSLLKELFSSICLVAKSLINNPNSSVYSVAKLIYKTGFEVLDKKHKHMIVNILIDYITSSNGSPRDHSLDVLLDLCTGVTQKKNASVNLVQYSMELKTLLDYIDYFTLGQIRKVYFIICSIAYSNDLASSTMNKPTIANISSSISSMINTQQSQSDLSIVSNNNIQDNLHILINKQLSSNSLKYKQIGVIGALMMIKNMAKKSESLNSTENSILSSMGSQSVGMLSSVSSEIKHIWAMILDSSRSSPESLGLFEDDLTSLIRKDSLPENLENLIKKHLEPMTKNLFKIEPNFQGKTSTPFKVGYEFGLDEATNGVLNLFPLIMNDMQKKNASLLDKQKVEFLPSIAISTTIRLCCALERKNVLLLKDYLGCPILTIKKDFLYSYGSLSEAANSGSLAKFKSLSDDEKKIVCDSLFHMINWFTELINAFSPHIKRDESEMIDKEENDLNLKLISRITTAWELQQLLISLLPHMKYYRPPMAVFGLVDSSADEMPYIHTLFKVKEAKPKAAKSKGKRKDKKETKKSAKKQKVNKENEDSSTIMDESSRPEHDELEDHYDEEKELIDDSDEEDLNSAEARCFTISEIEAYLSKITIYFREFDLSILNFIKLPLEIHPGNGNNSIAKLKPAILNYVLNDVNKKLAIILKPPSNSKLAGMQSTKPTKMQLYLQQNEIDPKDTASFIIKDCMDSLCDHLDAIFKHVLGVQEKNDNLRDPVELNTSTNLFLLKSFNHVLKFFCTLFVWMDASNEFSSGVIQTTVKKIGSKLALTKSNAALATQTDKINELCGYKYLNKLKDVVLDLNTANVLTKIMDLLCNRIFVKHSSISQEIKAKMRLVLTEMCKEFLKNEYNPKFNESKQVCSEAVYNILNVLFKNDANSIELVDEISSIIVGEQFMQDRKNCDAYSTLSTYFLAYNKAILEFTVSALNMDILKNYNLKKSGMDEAVMVEVLIFFKKKLFYI